MLAEIGLLTAEEALKLEHALNEIGEEIQAGRFPFSTAQEDIHTHVEQALIARLGDLGRKLHTGRSRNDQVVTDLKLWLRDAAKEVDSRIAELQRAFLRAAERNHDLILPGYTHLQRAQPILASHYFLAYIEKFQRDRDRIQAAYRRANSLPLGTAALAGTSIPINRDRVRVLLGFDSLARNSLDVSSDRDFVLDYVYALTTTAIHLSGWAEEWVIWSTTEFNFLVLPDAFCTGSSIMPQKKNPDVLELTRGRSGRAVGALVQLLVLLKGLPLAYNRDLQEDKIALFMAHDSVTANLALAAPLVDGAQFRRDVIEARLEDGFLDATTLMEALVLHGVPMRSAHEAVGRLVRLCEQRHCRLRDLPPEEFDAVAPDFSAKVYKVLGVKNALAAFQSSGSTAPEEVARQLNYWQQRLNMP
jgi:argininosuccinate lyase